ncbi:EF-P 5-aminopentanol modification-associated protein YfmF [Bacillus solitudinis]|uniref:EF-P 5-aminopentanol modification-associated protein YfmF n=1 Tax=Bacillus solitudinis TaxID=2014074 RepID=UPI000C24FB51|nr:pitrilysin family protein [Bacillus solitudinis]
MKGMIEKNHHLPGMNVHTVKTDKYKTNTLVLMLKAPLSNETVANRALLPQVLQSSTAGFPSRKQFREKLDSMYGAMLTTDVQKKGEQHVITLRIDVANERFLSDSTPLFHQAIELLGEVLLNPHVEGKGFTTSAVENEKRALIQKIQSVYDDKMRYANVRITEEMCKDEPFRLTAFGTEQQVETLSSESLYDYYQTLLNTDRIDLYMIGAISEEDALQKVTEVFGKLSSRQASLGDGRPSSPSPEVRNENVVHEEQDVKQGKLHIGFRTYTTYADADYVAMQVCNGLFGGFSHSKLFINVREKESLAYYAASRYESHKGILVVMAGIEFSKYERAVTIIKEQLKTMQSGEFTEKEVEQTKAMLKNQILETVDVARGHVEISYHQVVSGYNRSLEQWIEEIDAVTKEDMIRVAKKIKLDTIYFLKGREESQ